MVHRDTTYGRNAEKARKEGQQGYESAKGDAMGELYCTDCGYKRAGKPCPHCEDE